MKLKESFTYDDASVEDVFGLISSKDFRERACEEMGDLEYDVNVDKLGNGADVNIKRKVTSDMPDFIKKLTGDTVSVKQVEKWAEPDGDGSRKADILVQILGQPAEMKGTAIIANDGELTTFAIDGDIKVSIPLLGKKIEPEVAKAIVASLRGEVELGNKEFRS